MLRTSPRPAAGPSLCRPPLGRPSRRPGHPFRDLSLLVGLLLFSAGGARGLGPAPADLRLEWTGESGAGEPGADGAEPVRGREGSTASVGYRLRNVGGTDAFAAVLESWTALGRLAPPQRLQPGPRAGDRRLRTVELPLALGMRELCIEVRLQNLDAAAPGDPRPEDNRICRRVVVEREEEPVTGAQPIGRKR